MRRTYGLKEVDIPKHMPSKGSCALATEEYAVMAISDDVAQLQIDAQRFENVIQEQAERDHERQQAQMAAQQALPAMVSSISSGGQPAWPHPPEES